MNVQLPPACDVSPARRPAGRGTTADRVIVMRAGPYMRTAEETNERVLNKAAGVERELLDTVKARKLAYCGHSMSKQGSCPEKEIMQGTMPGARRRGRPRTAWMDNIKTWTGLAVEESIRMTGQG